jgi:hypothetical protein
MLKCSRVHSTLEQASVHEFKRATERKLRDVYCPDHRQRPRVKVTGASVRDATVSLTGCCDKLMTLANQAIVSTNNDDLRTNDAF